MWNKARYRKSSAGRSIRIPEPCRQPHRAWTRQHPGISIDPATGVLTWTPTAAQAGVQTFAIVISDVAGNTQTQDLSLTVAADALMQFRLEVTDTSGTPISSINVGEDFQLNVYVQDLRAVPYGVFAAFLDVVYSSQYVAVNGSLTGLKRTCRSPDDASAT